MPTESAMSRTVVPANPFSANSSAAAARISLRQVETSVERLLATAASLRLGPGSTLPVQPIARYERWNGCLDTKRRHHLEYNQAIDCFTSGGPPPRPHARRFARSAAEDAGSPPGTPRLRPGRR